MKAIYYEEHGTPEVLTFGDLPVPEPAEDEVLVQVAAAGVNPIDRRLRAGELQEYITRTFPVVPGWDLSGKIDKVGSAVKNWKEGDAIVGLAFTWSIQHGTYAEYAPVKAESIALKPESIPYDVAAGLPLVSLTAWESLVEYGELKSGQTVLIHAAAGGLGSVAVSIAKYLGCKVYATASEKNINYVRELGADVVIDYRNANYAEVIRAQEPQGLDLVLQSLLDDDISREAIELCKDGGTVVYLNNEPPELAEIESRGIKTKFLHHRPDGESLGNLMGLFASGALRLPPVEILPLEKAKEAHIKSESGRTVGKVVLHVQNL